MLPSGRCTHCNWISFANEELVILDTAMACFWPQRVAGVGHCVPYASDTVNCGYKANMCSSSLSSQWLYTHYTHASTHMNTD